MRRTLIILSLAAGMLACSSEDPTAVPTPQSVAVTGGNAQNIVVGQAASALTVKVTGTDGQPLAGARVTWAVTAGGGSVSPATSQTDATGTATTTWTMGHVPGAGAVSATVDGIAAPASFTATAIAGAISSVVVTPTSPTIDALGATVQLAAQARDAFGNAITGATFTWTTSAAGTATVDAQGVATGVAVGTANITASAGAISGSTPLVVRQVLASLSVTPATPSVAQGATSQLGVVARDARNNIIATAPAVTWSSATQSVATVNATGLVTGVAAGTSNITATSGTITASAAVTVVGNLTVSSNTSLSGTMTVANLTIPAGVTLTASGDLNITALGAVQMAGTITGDCRNITITGKGAATYTGAINNTCTTQPTGAAPSMVLTNSGALTVTNATITYAGAVRINNKATSAGVVAKNGAQPGVKGAAGNSGLFAAGSCIYDHVNIVFTLARAHDGAQQALQGGDANDGDEIRLECDGDLTAENGTVIKAMNGGNGGTGGSTATTSDATAKGGRAGNGGNVTITATGNMTFSGLSLTAGSGGHGGDAALQGMTPGGNVTTIGTDGGVGGNLLLQAVGNVVIQQTGLTIDLGVGGVGGSATSLAGNGANAAATAATAGGKATATAGNGGNSVLGVLSATGTVTGRGNITFSNGNGGAGGFAFVTGGNGGNGNATFQNGADGGDMRAIGGVGGIARTKDITGSPSGRSGDGGKIEFHSGVGGNGANRCEPPALGGSGGKGGGATGHPGAGGAGDNPGAKGVIDLATGTGNGGNGDNGSTAGTGGAAGVYAVDAGFTRDDEGPDFQPGANGVACVQTIVRHVTLQLSAIPHAGSISPGTYPVPILDATTGAQIGTVPFTTVGTQFHHFFGSSPDRLGATGGGNGWRIDVGNLIAPGLNGARVQNVTFMFMNTVGVSSSTPILLKESNSAGTVIKTTPSPGLGQSVGNQTLSLDALAFFLSAVVPDGVINQMDMGLIMDISYLSGTSGGAHR